eukprot:Nitzschia sp. Nitz4//scaffold34_size148208//121684//127830//NITZ4_002993-RA/size148208-processed-gene-0.54-mRNA-1//-1//CDS//3329548834//444//frame0
MATRSSRYTHVSLGSAADKIKLSGRQLQLLQQRRNRLDNPGVQVLPKPAVPSKQQPAVSKPYQDLGEAPTTTAPSTSWGSSAASDASSSTQSTVSNSRQHQFYGQGLEGEAKKLYDDTGASFHDSKSEATASSAARTTSTNNNKLEESSTALTEALTKTSSHDVHHSGNAAASESSSHASLKEQMRKAELKKRLLATMAEKRKDTGMAPPQPKEKPRGRRTSFGLNLSKKTRSADDHQRTFLRTLMQSAYSGKDPKKAVTQEDNASEAASQASSQGSSLSWSQRRSTISATSSAQSSRSGSSSTAEEKAILRKVLERTRKKKMSTNPRRHNVMKSSTSRMKRLLSPRNKRPQESLADDKSQNKLPKAAASPKTRRSPKFARKLGKGMRSPRLFSSGTDGSHADDEAESHTSDTLSAPTVERNTEKQSEVSKSLAKEVPVARKQPVEVETVSTSSTCSESSHDKFEEALPVIKENKTLNLCPSIVSRPSMLNDNEIEVQMEEPTPEDDGYDAFLATLQAEVAGSHSQLWKSFNELFQGAPFPRTSLGPPSSQQFDDNTKETVTDISNYLKQNFTVECVSGAQLANDKSVKEVSAPSPTPSPTFGQHMLKPTKSMVSSSDSAVSAEDSDKENDKENGGALFSAPSADSINSTPATDEFEVTLGQYVRKSMGGQQLKPVAKKEIKAVAPPQVKPVVESKPLNPPLRSFNSKPATNRPNPSVLKPAQPTPNSTGEDAMPWTAMKLRSVTDVGKSEATGSSIPASWAKVKLRSVKSTAAPESSVASVKEVEVVDAEEDAGDFRRILVSKRKPTTEKTAPTPKPKTPKPDEPEVIEIIDLADIPATESNPIDLTDKTNETEPIDLTNVPAETPRATDANSQADTKASADGTVLVSLAPEPNSDPVKILLNSKGIAKIETKPGDTKARVMWRHELDEVTSAMLDLSAFKVKLLLNSGDENKDIAFSTSEQCMKFANALHDLTNNSEPEAIEEASETDDSLYFEQLNDEEQRVLEEFREIKRQNENCQPVLSLGLAPHNLLVSTAEAAGAKPMSVVNAGTGPSSPLSEVSGPGSALSSEEMRLAEAYQKMLKLQVPKEAVRHKMEKDQVDQKIVDFVLGIEAAAGDVPLTEDEKKIVVSYEKMLKMGIPSDAVRHKMTKDAIPQKLVDAVLGEAMEPFKPPPPLPKAGATSQTLTPDEEKVAQPYRKMLKMMIPKEAVAHKMKKEEVSDAIIAAVVGEEFCSKKAAAKKGPAGVPTLTDEEESVASSYRKMLSLRIPKEAIRQKMASEGISKKIIAAVLGEKLVDGDTKTPVKRGKQGFHWSPLVSSAQLKNSVWSKTSFDSGFLIDDDDLSSHVEQFQKKPDEDEKSKMTTKSTGEGKVMAKLIDLSRANNVAITLKAFNEFSHDELSNIIEFVDPFEKVKGDRALFMKDLLPATAEIKVIKSYTGEQDRLVPAEKWFRQIIHIKRVEDKINVLRTMESFRNEAIALGETFEKLSNVCNQVMSSDKLPDVLEMVRQIGNRMNNGRGQEAAGFKLDFLPRLAQTKGSDKKTTALDLVVMIFNTSGRRQALMLGGDFPDCYEVSRLQLGELHSDVKMLGAAMKKCQKELDSLRKEQGKPSRTMKCISETKSDSGAAGSVTKETSEDGVRTCVSNMHEELFAKRTKLINSAIGGAPDNEESAKSIVHAQVQNIEASQDPGYNLAGAIGRIESFLVEANLVYPELEAKRDQAVQACTDLAEFFCESGGERMAPSLLGILSEFSSNLDRAVKKYDHQQKLEAKRKASADKKSQDAASNAPNESKPKKKSHVEKKSLVLMVNEMLKVAGDKQKQDFVNGVTYDRPDSRMKAIYEAEQEKEASPMKGSPRKNILSAIQERRQLNESQDPHAALSELALAMQKRSLSRDSISPKSAGPTLSPTYSALSSTLEESVSMDEEVAEHQPRKSNRMSIAERWTRKSQDDEDEDIENLEIEKTDSQILASDSHDSEDRKYRDKRRLQYVSRWASQGPLLGKEECDLDDESDASAFVEIQNKTRQQYMSRWASKPSESSEDESEALLEP